MAHKPQADEGGPGDDEERRPAEAMGLVEREEGGGEMVLVQEGNAPRPVKRELSALRRDIGEECIYLASRASVEREMGRFDFTWFIPAMVKYRRQLGEVLLMSFFLQLFALLTPIFFQVVMDKVLVHRGLTTLDVIVFGLVVVVVFEVVMGGVRSYLFAHATNRMDSELGARLFRHLLSLP